MSEKPTRVARARLADAEYEDHEEFGGSEWVFYRSPDGTRVAAAFRESGRHTFEYPFDEFVYVLRGHTTVTVHGGETFVLSAGDVAYFLEGMTVDFDMSDDFEDITFLVSDKPVSWR
jgi:uncharacterized cupin superfamily protein